MGDGPMTGRGLGPCGRGLAFRRGPGRSFGRGFSGGFGRGFGFRQGTGYGYAYEPEPLSKEQEKQILEQDLKAMESEIGKIRERINELSKSDSKK